LIGGLRAAVAALTRPPLLALRTGSPAFAEFALHFDFAAPIERTVRGGPRTAACRSRSDNAFANSVLIKRRRISPDTALAARNPPVDRGMAG
jgi:hypothetical protein